MARPIGSLAVDADETAVLAADWYRRRLREQSSKPRGFAVPPSTVGPTWTRNADGFWSLPVRSLGWTMLGWCGAYLQHGRGEPWTFTDEQARFLLWWYALDEAGRFTFRDGVLQRLKGWGKDPVGACLASFELVGPCRFDRWDDDGNPVGKDVPDAWVQTAAVSLEQTKNTMRLLPTLFTDEAKSRFGIQVGRELVHACGDERLLQAVTSSPATLEGARSTFVLLNETHLWTSSNAGHEMAAVIERNATKSADGAARTLRITNAYNPSRDSVAQQDRETFEKIDAGATLATGLLYDSLEAGPAATLDPDGLAELVESVRGDAVWLDVERIVAAILDPRNPPSRSRRFWLNQIVAAEDAWIDPNDWDACADPSVEVPDGTEIVLFFDGSKSDDATALVAAVVETGHIFTVGIWQRPQHAPDGWTVPRSAVDRAVRDTFDRLSVAGFYADPGFGDDETGARYWDALIDQWADELGRRLRVQAVTGGRRKHPVLWDMRAPGHVEAFTTACERFLADVEERRITHDGNARLRDHVRNARRRPNRFGVSIGKEHRESSRKIDAAVCAVGATLVRRAVLQPGSGKRRTGRVV